MSTLNVDALVGNTSANAITVRGEGSATTSLQQGLAKAWVNIDGQDGVSIRDGFNAGSLTDHNDGLYTTSYSNAFNNINFSFTYCGSESKAETTYQMGSSAQVTGSHQIQLKNAAGTVTSRIHVCGTFHGDLA